MMHLNDVETSIGTFVRRAFLLAPEQRRTILAASSELGRGFSLVVQFVVPQMGQEYGELDCLSRLSVNRVLDLYHGYPDTERI